MSFPETLVMLLAGGRGERLHPLTRDRTKPAVPFGGIYRIVDFTLSNCVNSGLRHIVVLTQYKSESLDRHLRNGWHIFNPEIGEYIDTVPPQQRFVDRWYEGTADAIFQNLHILNRERPKRVLILSGDHIYKMDYRGLIEAHDRAEAAITVATFEAPLAIAHELGVLSVDEDDIVTAFTEKPTNPTPAPGRTDVVLGNMGVYVFDTEVLVRRVVDDSRTESAHDFGRNIIPALVESGARVVSYPLKTRSGADAAYWRDVGTLDAYFDAHMDLLGAEPEMPLRDLEWPIRTLQRQFPPAFMGAASGGGPEAHVTESLIAAGSRITGATIRRSVLSPGVTIEPGAVVEEAILLDNVRVGAGARLKHVVVDKFVEIPPGFEVGGNPTQDAELFSVSPSGLVVVEKRAVFI
jgi:glucose-1-phosphate adenylyltransferase